MSSLRNDDVQGGQHFDVLEHSTSMEDCQELLTTSTEHVTFQPIRSIPIIVTVILLTLLQVVSIFCMSYTAAVEDDQKLSVCVYIHVCFWFLLLLADRFLRVQHYISRTAGYLQFYRQTRVLRRTPIIISSGAENNVNLYVLFSNYINAMMLLCVVLLNDYCKPSRHGDHVIVTSNPNSCDEITPLQRTTCIQILVCAEAIIIVPILVCYLVRSVRFNKKSLPPDVLCDELQTATGVTSQQNEVGYREYDYYEDMLERQADMITYLKQHNASLAKHISDISRQQTV